MDNYTFSDVWSDGDGRIHNTSQRLSPEQILALDLPFGVGDKVKWNKSKGFMVAENATLTIERISLDHLHIGGHSQECYHKDGVIYTVVLMEDDKLVFRSNFRAPYLVLVESAGREECGPRCPVERVHGLVRERRSRRSSVTIEVSLTIECSKSLADGEGSDLTEVVMGVIHGTLVETLDGLTIVASSAVPQ